MSAEYSIAELAQALDVSRSGYYAWLKRQAVPGPRSLANRRLLGLILLLYQEHEGRYGSPRICASLRRQGYRYGHNRVAKLMRRHGLKAKTKRPFRPRTTDSAPAIAPNRLAQAPAPQQRDRIWVSDITYVHTEEGWLYLAAVMDLWSRRIVGWHAANHLQASLVEEALKGAVQSRRPAPGLLHHSDRGFQYTSSAVQALLTSAKMIPSMSRKGDCYDNAAMESFWSTLKSELVHGTELRTHREARQALFDYIELYYNRKRLHSSLDYRSPLEFENANTANRN